MTLITALLSAAITGLLVYGTIKLHIYLDSKK
jgi:hypothetical protein